MLEPLQKLTSNALRELAASLLEGTLSGGVSTHAIQQITGSDFASAISHRLEYLLTEGWTPEQISHAALAIVEAREGAVDPERLFDLVLSGPDVPGVPTRDTSALMYAMIEDCQQEVLLIGYAIHQSHLLFKRLAQKMAENPNLKVRFCLNIERKFNDTSLNSEIVHRFITDFNSKHWPWEPKPDVFYDPRSLSNDNTVRSSLHAKCLIIDRQIAMITSANFTEAAQKRNIEAGVVIRYEPFVQRLTSYFDTLCQMSFQQCPTSD